MNLFHSHIILRWSCFSIVVCVCVLGVCSTGEIPAGCVLGLNVDDPRLTLPQRRGKTVPDLQPNAGTRCAQVCVLDPELWEPLRVHADEPGSNPGRV